MRIEGQKGKKIFEDKIWVDYPLPTILRFVKGRIFINKPDDYKPTFPCAVKLTFYIANVDRCDLDNLVKQIIDFLNANDFFQRDDNEVFQLEAEKRKSASSDTEHISVEIFEWIPEHFE